jgi:superfamily II DNA or RNA helicase
MRIRRISPVKGYRNENLWIPKRMVGNLQAIRNSLTFPVDQKAPIHAYEETSNHLIVPREYIPFAEWPNLDFEIEDRTQTVFPKVSVSCSAQMRDAIQVESKAALLESGNGILSLACGKGKTVISISAWADLGVPGLVVVHTNELRNQWRERILEFTSLRKEDVGIYQGDKADWKKPITIAMVHTLAQRAQAEELPEGFETHFGVVIYDEVHHLGAPYFNTTASIGRGLRWGLSATPERDDGLDALYQGHVGPVIYQNLEQDIIPEAFFVETNTRVPPDVWPDLRDRTGEVSIPKLLTWLSKHEQRNSGIIEFIDIALKEGRKILCLSSRVDQLDELAAVYGDKASKIHGKVGKEREGALHRADLIFATTQIAKEGLDRKDLDTIMLLLPLTKETMFRQILGRIQRDAGALKQQPAMVIFEDGRIPICLNMCRKLRRHLTAFKYPFYKQ